MLLLDSRSQVIDDVSVFPDHADPQQWYYLPTAPHLTTVRDDAAGSEVPSFLLFAYAGADGVGGFLNMDVNLEVATDRLDGIARELQRSAGLDDVPRVVPVPLVGGTVRLQMLDGETDRPTEVIDGHPRFVLAIDHESAPGLYGSNQAAFSVHLDKAGFTAVEACLDGAILPIVVSYSLEYLGLRPAYNVTLSIDWDRVQKHLDETFSASVMFFSTEISTAVDELVESRAIVLTADTFVPEGDDTSGIIERRDLALAQVRQMITEAFFTPSIPPWTPEKTPDWERALNAIGGLAAKGYAAAAGGPATTAGSFSYKRTDYTRIDRKKLDVNFSERVTIQNTIHPQGHLGGLLSLIADSGLPRETFVKRIALDDPWFARRRLTATYQPGLAVDEIAAINVHATYGGGTKNAFLTPGAWSTEFDWANQLVGGELVTGVDLTYDVLLKDADTSELPGTLTSAVQTVHENAVPLTPEVDLFTFKPIPVRAENVPWATYSSVEVELRYTDDGNGIRQHDTVRLTAEAGEATWMMFQLDRSRSAFDVRIVYRALDHRDVDLGWRTVDEEGVTVRDPFPSKRVLEISPPVVWTDVANAFVDVRYVDSDAGLVLEDSFTFTEGSAPARFAVDLRDPTKRDVFYRVTFQYRDGRTVELPESVTAERRIILSPEMKGRRAVRVHRPRDFLDRKMRKVTVELRFEDLLAGLSFADVVTLDSATAEGAFEYDYVDPARDSYEYRSTFLFENGLSRVVEWQPSTALDLVVATP